MSRTFNIANLQFKWFQKFIDIHFLETGIIEVGITGPSIYFIYQKLHRPLSSIVPLTYLPVKSWNLMQKASRSAGHVMS